ncbi:MAG: SDR family oxidoreductase [Acidobacteriota bacterium]
MSSTSRLTSNETSRRFLITGAGSGIGRALALRLQARGHRLALIGRRVEALEQTAAAFRSTEPLILPADVTQPSDLATAARTIDQRWGALDGIVNNAGLSHYASIEQIALVDWERVIATNLTAPFLVLQTMLPLLRRGEHRSVVNVGSTLGAVGLRGASAYCAAKAGLINWTRAVALDLAPEQIRVNVVLPGVVDTPMLDAERGEPGTAAERKQRLAALHPLGRLASADDVAAAIAMMLSPDAAFITGSTLTVDGGQTAGFAE